MNFKLKVIDVVTLILSLGVVSLGMFYANAHIKGQFEPPPPHLLGAVVTTFSCEKVNAQEHLTLAYFGLPKWVRFFPQSKVDVV